MNVFDSPNLIEIQIQLYSVVVTGKHDGTDFILVYEIYIALVNS